MIDSDYAVRHLIGVWKMAWNAPDWENYFDRSVDGVFRSFWAAAFTAPIALAGFISIRHAANQIPEFADAAALQTPIGIAVAAEAVAFVAEWSVQLVVLVIAARMAGAGRRVASLIIGFNWMQVYVTLAQATPLAILGIFGSREAAAILSFPMLVFAIAFNWGFLRRGLRTNVGTTIAVFALLSLLGLIVSSLVGAGTFALYSLLS